MFDAFHERRAARHSPRFGAFVAGKDAYESFLAQLQLRFDQLTEADHLRARQDPRLHSAEREFAVAIDLSQQEGELADAAVARYQLGLVRHLQGALDEAEALFRAALQVLVSLPRQDTTAVSACHYHLGVIALKQGMLPEAIGQLRRSRRIDEAHADLQGMRLCDLALDACAQAGGDLDADLPPPAAAGGDWTFADPEPEPAAAEELGDDAALESGPVHYQQRQLIWVASYSVAANDAVFAQLQAMADEFGRPVAISRAAFGAADPQFRELRQSDPDQNLCAAILVLERAGLENASFQELAYWCMDRVLARPDFRLLVHLGDLTIEELQERSDRSRLVEDLFDTAQIAEAPSLAQLRRTLVPFVRRVENLRAAAHWRQLRLQVAALCGHAALLVLIAAGLLALLGYPAWLLKWKLTWLPHGPQLAALACGMLAFPLQSPLIFLLLRGLQTAMLAPRDNAALRGWVFVGIAVMIGSSHLQKALAGPVSWLLLGLAGGVLLDAVVRAGRRATREMIDLDLLRRAADSPALEDPRTTILRGDALNPFACPLLPAVATRVFISYTRSSSGASRLARSLHRSLAEAGAAPFLDRASIPTGASWRRSLNDHLGECDVFVCLLDAKGVERPWVAAELLAAIEARQLTGVPEIVILVDPSLPPSRGSMLPIFRGVLSAADDPPAPGRPRVLRLSEQTCSSLVWGFAPGRFEAISVFPRLVARPVMVALMGVAAIGGLGIFAGFLLGFCAILEKGAGFPFTASLAQWGCLAPLALLSAFWLGFNARATIAWGCEIEHPREMGIATPALATGGLALATLTLAANLSSLYLGWSLVLALAGWLLVASVMRTRAAKGSANR